MKRQHLTTVVIFLIFFTTALSADPIKYEDYKKLSKEVRLKIVNKATPELQKQYNQWDQVISMGGQWWTDYQAKSLIADKHLLELGGVTTMQLNYWAQFYFQSVDENKKSGMTEENAQKAAAAICDTGAIENEHRKDSRWYLVKLAPTPEALALNEKAKALVAEWEKKFPYGQKWKITKEDLIKIDAAAKDIRDQLRALPQLTPEQIEAVFAAQPEEQPHK